MASRGCFSGVVVARKLVEVIPLQNAPKSLNRGERNYLVRPLIELESFGVGIAPFIVLDYRRCRIIDVGAGAWSCSTKISRVRGGLRPYETTDGASWQVAPLSKRSLIRGVVSSEVYE